MRTEVKKIYALFLSGLILIGYTFDGIKIVPDDSFSDRLGSTINLANNNSKIFCIILTTPKKLESHSKIVYSTWAKKCDNHSFISLIPNEPVQFFKRKEIKYQNSFNLLKPQGFVYENYDGLTDKVLKTIEDVFQNHPEYGWYLKADDDTFIFVDNLRLFVRDKKSRAPITFGYDFKNLYGVEKGYHSGGAGYLLSNRAVEKLSSHLKKGKRCYSSGVEDLNLARCFRKLKVFPQKSIDNEGRERFHPFDIKTHYDGNYPDWLQIYASNPPKKVKDFF